MFYLIEEKDLISLMSKVYYEELADVYVPVQEIINDIQEWGSFLSEDVKTYEDIASVDMLPRWEKNKYIMPVNIRDTSIKTIKNFYRAIEDTASDSEVKIDYENKNF